MAVYTEVSDEELEAFVAQYDIARVVSCKGIAEGIENSNYLLQTETGNYILTLYEKRVEPADLPFFLGLMEHLAAQGVPCPTPLQGRDGKALRQVAGRPAAIVSFLNGVWPRRSRPNQCGQLGDAVAGLHIAGSDFTLTRPNALSVNAWRPLFESCAGRADEVEPGLADEISAELEVLERDWPQDLPAGVIHADLFPDNVFFLADHLSGLIDFYFACNDSFAYELAILLNAWCFEPDGQFNITKARLMLAAYRRRRPFSEAELKALPLLARGAALRFLLTRLYDWLNHVEGAFVKPKDPLEYLQKLRFHQSVRSPAAYGLDWRPWAI
ncbi:MAG: homoserine kinase [Alphaproteobacteria bacterium]|jgi:homoserine kinase type II|nr:homoserine kinase [Rhodospirillaceae bacterium]MDP6403643.1 homoserine kinase [Alphaproteobacteria bacterium]MDP6623231.1 homoserine kinase [Alphaproteobacteria bacterium]|tara:strand:- start:268 stop:1248 length:981 start_codon:yes stop_codon:yes gene_type:complete